MFVSDVGRGMHSKSVCMCVCGGVYPKLRLPPSQSYLQCLDFLREALRLLSSQGEGGGRAVSSRARQQLEPQLKEQVLAVELLAAREDVRRNGPEG